MEDLPSLQRESISCGGRMTVRNMTRSRELADTGIAF